MTNAFSIERLAFTGLSALLLMPVVAQGLWRPLCHLLNAPPASASDSAFVTVSALSVAVAALVSAVAGSKHQRWLVGACGGLTAALSALLFGLGGAALVSLVCVAAAAAFLFQYLPPRLPQALDGLMIKRKILTLFYILGVLFSVWMGARLSVFMGEPRSVELQVAPGNEFLAHHACLTAYVHGSTLARSGVENLYDARYWPDLCPPDAPPEDAQRYAPFRLDAFAYPPSFLLLTGVLAPFDGDYLAQRALWFGLNGVLLAVGLWITARWIGGDRWHRVLLMGGLLWGLSSALLVLQVGNVHTSVVVCSVLAMVAFDRERPVVGGALLALVTLSKISPGLLGIILLMQRRWRGVLWTVVWGVGLVFATVLVFGMAPVKAFLSYELPRLSSGEALSFLAWPGEVTMNLAPFSIPFKIQLLGFDVGDPWVSGRVINQVYTLVVIALAVVVGRRSADRATQAMWWMALLVLASTRSPFAPPYVAVAWTWALSVLVSETSSRWGAWLLGTVWVLGSLPLPFPESGVIFSLFLQPVVVLSVAIWLIVRRTSRGLGVSQGGYGRT